MFVRNIMINYRCNFKIVLINVIMKYKLYNIIKNSTLLNDK